MTQSLRPMVFWPPFLLLFFAVLFSFINQDAFLSATTQANDWILHNFGWMFSIGTLSILMICIGIYFSPLGKVTIGGPDAKPILSKWQWFSITLCTTVAIGILFWATAEPMYHLTAPPKSLHLDPNSPEAAMYALSTMFLHWTFTPYAIYTLPALMFAFAYYNMKKPFSLGSALYPLFGNKSLGVIGKGTDAICLYALVAGMAASLGTGVLTISGGVHHLFNIKNSPTLWAFITLLIVATFAASSASGLKKGIRILSDLNAKIFFFLVIFIFVFGPTTFILGFGVESFANYLDHFFQKSLFTGSLTNDSWPKGWTLFYWANWLAWAPITALFLGRITYGYKVRTIIMVNLVIPALFSACWMAIFSGTAIHMELVQNLGLSEVLRDKGPESIIYFVLSQFPMAKFIIMLFLFTSFLSYVTAADSNTTAMGSISTTGISPDNPEPKLFIKLLWGVSVGVVSWVMISFAGIDGIKMLSNLGGFPALFLILAIGIALVKVAINPAKYDLYAVRQDVISSKTQVPSSTQ